MNTKKKFQGLHCIGILRFHHNQPCFSIKDNNTTVCTNKPIQLSNTSIECLIISLKKLKFHLHHDQTSLGLIFSDVFVSNPTYKIKLKCMRFNEKKRHRIKAYLQQDYWDVLNQQWIRAMKHKNDATLNIVRLFNQDYIHLLDFLQCTISQT